MGIAFSAEKRAATFWAKVNKTASCWLFTGAKQKGYGTISVNGKQTRTHRYVYELCVGPIPNGLAVCHHCDTPACVRPEHLFIGTKNDNMQDCKQKGRNSPPPRNYHLVGERHWNAKLSANDVAQIRRLCSNAPRRSGVRKMVAERFNISMAVVTEICAGRLWKSVK